MVCPDLSPDRSHPPLLLEVLRLRHRQGQGADLPQGEYPPPNTHTSRTYHRRRFPKKISKFSEQSFNKVKKYSRCCFEILSNTTKVYNKIYE